MRKKHKGKFIQKAIKRPGRLTEAAEREGVSTREEADKWSHSSDPSKRSAGNLGKRFMKGGDLHRKSRKRSRKGGHKR